MAYITPKGDDGEEPVEIPQLLSWWNGVRGKKVRAWQEIYVLISFVVIGLGFGMWDIQRSADRAGWEGDLLKIFQRRNSFFPEKSYVLKFFFGGNHDLQQLRCKQREQQGTNLSR